PSLDELIRTQRSSGSYRVFQHIVVGHNCPWENYFGTLHRMERAYFGEPDRELCALVHEVLKEIAVPLCAGRREDIPGALATSRPWAELTTRLPQERRNEFHGWLEELVG